MLTDTQVRQARPKEKVYKLRDERGLLLMVRPTGAKWWLERSGKTSPCLLGRMRPVWLQGLAHDVERERRHEHAGHGRTCREAVVQSE